MAVRIQPNAEATDGQPITSTTLVADPEPHALYQLIRQTFVQHTMTAPTPCCTACGADWPCAPVRLAFRLREGF
jgi:hypothetical protein